MFFLSDHNNKKKMIETESVKEKQKSVLFGMMLYVLLFLLIY